MNSSPETILIVCIRLIGDVILTTPLIGLLKEAYPEAAIDLLVGKGTGEFLEKDPRIRRVHYSEKGGTGYFREIFRKYDLAINMNASDRGNIAVLFAGRTTRVGFYQGWGGGWRNLWKRLFFTHPIPFPGYMHVARISQLVSEGLGHRVERLEAKVYWDAADQTAVTETLRTLDVIGSYFVIHPFARWDYKYWRMERFAEVSDALVDRYGLQPVWTSSPDAREIELLGQAALLCRHRPALITGEFSLNRMACLLASATFYLGLDTAVSHLAATVGVPMVALYGPTFAERWSPWNNSGPAAQQCPALRGNQQCGSMVLLQSDEECVPCGNAGCGDLGGESRCLAAIGTEDVLAAAERLLAGKEQACNR
ncbi:glycosyltransferase family 9 protein [Geobacter argillaceus]|uniref:Heptosyltransferase-3 n=1 Tax=Geobacter argillaceus TaxID=345631 RepID=A0A562VN22_9BACT|nr:glycosyltransferase family 9 protein [Geobacter argillaceus]TWJ19288.1 heptosyltransferase-3 [Geobacter argillaceus]